jgi:hypothetical protein
MTGITKGQKSDRDLALGAAAEYKRLADEHAFPNSGTRVNIELANHYALQGILRLLRYQVATCQVLDTSSGVSTPGHAPESDDSVRIPLGPIAPSPRPDLDHQIVKVPVSLLSSVAQSLVSLPNHHELSVEFHQRNGHGTAYIVRTLPNGYRTMLGQFTWETP